MKKLLTSIACVFFILGCSKQKKETVAIQFLNGYWEIDYVINIDGNKKKFNFNEFIDYFETNDTSGFRTKVKPKLNRKYTSNFQKIAYHIDKKNDTILMKYRTSGGIITDKVFRANIQELGIKSENGILYFYKKYVPIIIDN